MAFLSLVNYGHFFFAFGMVEDGARNHGCFMDTSVAALTTITSLTHMVIFN